MKRVFSVFFAALLLMTLLILPISASESGSEAAETEVITEAVIETAATEAVIGSEEASAVIDIIENSGSKAEAIIALAEELGITVEEAERMINAVLMVGDKYLGESEIWVKFSNSVTEDIQFWAVIIVACVAALSMIGMIFMMVAKVNPNTRKSKANSEQAVQFSAEISQAYSQTLAKMEKMYAEALEKEALYEASLQAKEDKIISLEETYEKEHKALVTATSCALRVLKLVCDRTAMPMIDKATVDNFYSIGVDALIDGLEKGDAEKLDGVLKLLDKVGKQDG
jgi:hypothetical protein